MSWSLLQQQFPASHADLWWFIRWKVSGRKTASLRVVSSTIRSKQQRASLHNYHRAFSPSILFKSRWCIYIVVLTWVQFWRIRVLIYPRSYFYIVDNLLIAVDALTIRMLSSLSLDKILLLKFINWSTNFRGLPINDEMTPLLLKYMNSVLSEFTQRLTPLAAFSKLCSRNAVIARYVRSST